MLDSGVRPTGVERFLDVDEIIVTKTDPAGIITYANENFLRMSALTEDEAIGSPHNLIRHPDMPRGVYRLMWETIQAGQELFAYVVNLGADGAHYWVLAHVTPSYDATGRLVGYHSNRRSPRRQAITRAQELYARMRAAEAGQPNGRAAVEASRRTLNDVLAASGQTYDELVWTITNEATA